MSRAHDPHIREPSAATLARIYAPAPLLAGLFFMAFLALYARTAAPSVLSGDSAEFQLAAPLLGVPHPTTYPLYMLLGKLATLIVPFGDLAWRVTLVSAVCAALAVALFFMLAWRIIGSTFAAALGALALGLAPGLWNAATMAEVYALLAALLAGLAGLIVTTEKQEPPRGYPLIGSTENRPEDITPSLRHPFPLSKAPWRRLRLAAFVGGLGFTHHGLFAITGLPLLAVYLLWLIFRPTTSHAQANHRVLVSAITRDTLKQVALLALCFAAGLLPWLYTLAQYARYGPFAGEDYGLPRHYFWGAPDSWGQTLDLLTGGPLRHAIFRMPAFDSVMAVPRMVGSRLVFEFGPVGTLLGLLGSIVLLRRARFAWLGAAWVFFSTLAYLLLLGPAIQDAPVFTLPMLLPWALWIAAGVEFTLQKTKDQGPRTKVGARRSFALRPWSFVVLAMLVVATLAWGYTRLHVSSKRQLWLFRRFGEATLEQLPPGAAVITHWEQGMTLQYLIFVEGRRPDVWVDVVEPSDDDWGARARRRYADRAVFFVGAPSDVAGLPVELVREDDYADVFELAAMPAANTLSRPARGRRWGHQGE